jgi:xanthine dehydrogenase accessory factor
MVDIGELSLFVDVYPLLPRLIIVGAVHIAEFLVPMARLAGWDVIIVDPRAAFATPKRFPDVEIVHAWPDQALASIHLDSASYVAVLTHDPKLDDPALRIALTSRAQYVGALGSRHTDQLRRERLMETGLSEAQLARLHAPIGLPLGGRGPAEIAVSILAEIVKARHESMG